MMEKNIAYTTIGMTGQRKNTSEYNCLRIRLQCLQGRLDDIHIKTGDSILEKEDSQHSLKLSFLTFYYCNK